MLNINELEKRWLSYKVKSYLPHLVTMTGLILVSTLLLFIFSSENSHKIQKSTEKKEIKEFTTNDTLIKKIEPAKEELVPKKDDIQKIVLEPSLNFINNIAIDKVKVDKTKQSMKKNVEKIIEIKNEPIKEEIPIIEENINLQITKQNTSDDINLVIKRFKVNNNPALSLFIAKKYYELGDFNQAYNYSLITNQLNDGIEESWIIFSKSLVKLNKKEKAVKVLKQYIEYSNSNKARMLLDNILSGKFR